MFLDNLGANYLSVNPIFYSRIKHFAIDYHFVRELVQLSEQCVVHFSTGDQLAEALPNLSLDLAFFTYVIRMMLFWHTILRGRIIVF